ncbi:MAG: peptide deformylase [Pseudomonadota bacterium]
MAIREIIEVPDPRLKLVSDPYQEHEFDDELKTLVDDMFETMYDAPGIGLAAIQIAIPKRLLVIDLQEPDMDAEPIVEECGDGCCEPTTRQPTKKVPRVFINPEVFDFSEELASCQEGCLSIPEIFADVERPAECSVKYQDLDGSFHEERVTGMLATCLQHEMDHLNGILFTDHLSRLKRNMAMKKLKKIRAAA